MSLWQVSGDSRLLFSCGYWDHSCKCSSLADGRLLQSVRGHADVVCCLAISEDGSTLVTGSRDTTLMVWSVSHSSALGSSRPPIAEKPRLVLHGHDDEVTCVAVHAELDTILSGSADGSARD